MAVPQVVIPGYAAFHLGVETGAAGGEEPAPPPEIGPKTEDVSALLEQEREMDPEQAPE